MRCSRKGCNKKVPRGRRAWCSHECREKSRKIPKMSVVPPDEMQGLIDELGLRGALYKALRERDEAKEKQAGLIDAIYKAVADCLSTLTIAPVPPPPKDKRRSPEVAIAILSDWQLAKITADYDTSVCERRVEEYGDKVVKLADIQRADHPVNEVRVYLLGDLVEGELIFPGQAHLIDASLYRQTAVDGPRILSNFLRKMLANFEKVHVVGVTGNHGFLGGRARKDYHPESNADALMYEVARLILRNEPRLTWADNMVPGQRKWYAVDSVGEKSFLLFHGDQVKGGFAGFPWYGFGKKVMGWRMGAVAEPFDYALAGHFHTPTKMTIGPIQLWVSGSTESSNQYAAEMLAAQGTPSQWLLFCSPSHGVTSEYQVHLS